MAIANLYAEPSGESEVISQTVYGFAVECLDASDAWLKVCAQDAYAGWALRRDFVPWRVAGAPEVRVSQLSANVYREPDIKVHAPVLHLPWEARLEPCPGSEQGSERWLQVRLLDGRAAFVLRGDVSVERGALTEMEMLAEAQRFLGVTYTWGGVSAFGFDCSGLMQTLHRQRGIVLPRDAQAQCDWGGFVDVARGDLLAGDLLFFSEHLPKVTHVGLFLGEGLFVHATTEGHPGVQISRLAEDPWDVRLCAQRRLRA